MRFEQLDCRQREVVKATLCSDANILVLGGPGAGKTTTALWAARTFLENPEQGATLRVLFLTFSRSAVSQIASRSPAVLTGRYRERIEILTFHSLAYRLLRAFGRYSGYGTLLPLVQSEARDKLLGPLSDCRRKQASVTRRYLIDDALARDIPAISPLTAISPTPKY